jgi:hypothetical protein
LRGLSPRRRARTRRPVPAVSVKAELINSREIRQALGGGDAIHPHGGPAAPAPGDASVKSRPRRNASTRACRLDRPLLDAQDARALLNRLAPSPDSAGSRTERPGMSRANGGGGDTNTVVSVSVAESISDRLSATLDNGGRRAPRRGRSRAGGRAPRPGTAARRRRVGQIGRSASACRQARLRRILWHRRRVEDG